MAFVVENTRENNTISYSYKITGIPYIVVGLILAWWLDYTMMDPMAWVTVLLWPVALFIHLVMIAFYPTLILGLSLLVLYGVLFGYEKVKTETRSLNWLL